MSARAGQLGSPVCDIQACLHFVGVLYAYGWLIFFWAGPFVFAILKRRPTGNKDHAGESLKNATPILLYTRVLGRNRNAGLGVPAQRS